MFRTSSPASSEVDGDIDIANALTEDVDFDLQPSSARDRGFDASEILDVGPNSESSDGDEKYIAARQTELNRKASGIKSKAMKKSGGFQSMGLSLSLLKAITRKGFSVPTPIQRKAVPLILEGRDVVGMARTGSGKTAAFVIPMIEKLKAHSVKVGARAIVMSPSRELALQTLKVIKEFSKGTDLKCVLLVGGDSLEDQFSFMASNPDIIIATPGRFLHLKVEMSLSLSAVSYIVFDEADRLFEMGFATQLSEILHALPAERQTLLFSATLPRNLVEFARAGLQEPSLVRLDADSKISSDLESAFFRVKGTEKEGALLSIIQDVIKVPRGTIPQQQHDEEKTGQKRKRKSAGNEDGGISTYSTIIFAATKHHVEYLSNLLQHSGYAVSYIYGTLDQVARRNQISSFRAGISNILIVTDIAARGIDIPLLANVVNYDFPPQPKVYVHRVGRTARAGRRGWSFSLFRTDELPYLLDLQLFLGRRLVVGSSALDANFTQDVVVGALPLEEMSSSCEWVDNTLVENDDIASLRAITAKGEKLYMRTKPAASLESGKRAKQLLEDESWGSTLHPIFKDRVTNMEGERQKMLARVGSFRPLETVFEIGRRGQGKSAAADIMKSRRERIKLPRGRDHASKSNESRPSENGFMAAPTLSKSGNGGDVGSPSVPNDEDVDASFMSSDDEMEVIVSNADANPNSKSRKNQSGSRSFKDDENYVAYKPSTATLEEDRGYTVNEGNPTFGSAVQRAVLDLTTDEGGGKSFATASRAKGLRWDKKAKKFVNRANDEDGSRDITGKGRGRMIRGESGVKIAASFKSGKFEEWKHANKIKRLPRNGELESSSTNPISGGRFQGNRGRFVHKTTKAPKAADKGRDDFEKKRKRLREFNEKMNTKGATAKREVKTHDQIRKQRKVKAKRREKNARPARKRA